MKRPLLIYGAGGLGREVLSLVKALPEWEVAGFIDDSHPKGAIVHGVAVLGDFSLLRGVRKHTAMVLAIGDPAAKENILGRINNSFLEFPVLIHPSAVLQDADRILIGRGTVICAGAVLTTDIRIGEHVLINLNATIGHDVVIGDQSSVMPGVTLAGGVNVGKAVLIGSGVNVRNSIRLGSGCTVGMGSVVIRNTDPGIVVAGVPAKPLKK